MMNMFQKSWDKVYLEIDNEQAFKTNMITIALDGSEDHLASKKLMDLVGTEMKEFREKLLKTKPAESLKALRSQITKPEGVRMKGTLFDGDGEDLAESYDEPTSNQSKPLEPILKPKSTIFITN